MTLTIISRMWVKIPFLLYTWKKQVNVCIYRHIIYGIGIFVKVNRSLTDNEKYPISY